MSAAERLYRDANERLEKNFFNTMHPETTATYQPHISQSSKWIVENSNMYNGNLKDFHSR